MNLKPIIDELEYLKHKQADWPTYGAVQAGITAKDVNTQAKINQLFSTGLTNYVDTHKGNEIADGNRETQNQIFYSKNVDQPKVTHCSIPWETAGVNSYGDVFMCISPAWIPKFAGNILGVSDIYDVLNSSTAKKIRKEILNNRYYYCNFNLCGFPGQAKLKNIQSQPESDSDLIPLELDQPDDPRTVLTEIPKDLIFDFDHTCNYQCPSCRTEVVNYNNHPIIRPFNDAISNSIKTLIIDQIKDQPVNIRWAGGELFISKVYIDLLDYIINTGKNNIKHVIQTNGSYFKKKSELVEKLLPHVTELRISFDAATAETYHKVRVNGVWDNFIENVTWVMDHIRSQGLSLQVTADFVVQESNYKEIPKLRELCDQLGIHQINYQRMWSWATWPPEVFAQMNVYEPSHALYPQVVELIKQAKEK